MSDPARQPTTSAAEPAADQRDVVEKLLLSGLDQYFAGHYERAIQVWTRVFFLDRNHARARAYIERARAAIAERQRESDELLAGGLSALNSGDAQRARDLITSAVDRGGLEVEALTALDRLNRLSALTAGPPEPGEPTAPARAGGGPADAGPQAILVVTAVLLLGLAVWLVLDWNRVSAWWQQAGTGAVTTTPSAIPTDVDLLPQPDPAGVALARARALYRRGAFREAWQVLAAVRDGDARTAEVTALRADIQRAILASMPDPPGPAGSSPGPQD